MSPSARTFVLGMVLLGSTFFSGDDGSWDTRFGVPAGHINEGTIDFLASDEIGLVYAAASFQDIGGISANHTAVWDGEHRHPLGDGISGDFAGIGFDSDNNLLVGGNVRAVVFDQMGRQVSVVHAGELEGGRVHSLDFDVSGLAAGTYFLDVIADGIRRTARFVVLPEE